MVALAAGSQKIQGDSTDLGTMSSLGVQAVTVCVCSVTWGLLRQHSSESEGSVPRGTTACALSQYPVSKIPAAVCLLGKRWNFLGVWADLVRPSQGGLALKPTPRGVSQGSGIMGFDCLGYRVILPDLIHCFLLGKQRAIAFGGFLWTAGGWELQAGEGGGLVALILLLWSWGEFLLQQSGKGKSSSGEGHWSCRDPTAGLGWARGSSSQQEFPFSIPGPAFIAALKNSHN